MPAVLSGALLLPSNEQIIQKGHHRTPISTAANSSGSSVRSSLLGTPRARQLSQQLGLQVREFSMDRLLVQTRPLLRTATCHTPPLPQQRPSG